MILQAIFNLAVPPLVITYNSLLLKHTIVNALPAVSRTHSNEKRLTQTIVLINMVAFITSLPINIYNIRNSASILMSTKFDALSVLVSYLLQFLKSSNVRKVDNYWDWFVMLQLLNPGLNSLIYIIRVRNLRNFYKVRIQTVNRDNSTDKHRCLHHQSTDQHSQYPK